MRRNIFFILTILISACTQKPAEVIMKRGAVYSPEYSEVYIESPDGKIARNLRGKNDADKAQEVSIINKNAILVEKEYEQKTNYDAYIVKSGDSLWSIAKNNDTTIMELAKINNINKPYNVRIGQKIKIMENKSSLDYKPSSVKNLKTYKVKEGDSLLKIAFNFNISLTKLAEINNIEKPYNIRIGQTLNLSKNADGNPPIISKTTSNSNNTFKTYVVKNGDNLSSIAIKYDMSIGEIAKINNINRPYNLRIGQKLKIKSDDKVIIAKRNNNEKEIVKTNKIKKETLPKQNSQNSYNKKNIFIWPIKGDIVSNFGKKPNGLFNDGININASKGSNFKASDDGVIAYVGNELRGYGTIILIKHSNNWISAYAHCDEVKVARGDKVEKGDIIGTVGQTGNVNSPQLYFSLRNGREAVDPTKFLEN